MDRRVLDIEETLAVFNKLAGPEADPTKEMFRKALRKRVHGGRLIWLKCEMTGLEVDKDALLEVAVVVTEGGTLEKLAATKSIAISTPKHILAKMDPWCVKQHGVSGLTKACLESQISLEVAEDMVMKVVESVTEKGESPLAGNTVSFDRSFLEKHMPRLASHLHYRNVDVSSVTELARRWYSDEYRQAPKKTGGHRALGDIEDSIEELKYYRRTVFRQ